MGKKRHIKFYKYFNEWVETYKVGQEKKVVIGRMLMKALALFNDHEMPELLQSFNADEEDFSHDTHGKLLLKIIDAELDQM